MLNPLVTAPLDSSCPAVIVCANELAIRRYNSFTKPVFSWANKHPVSFFILSEGCCKESGQCILVMIVDFVFVQHCFALKSYFKINLYIFFI